MTLSEAKQQAQELSAQHQCGQHVNAKYRYTVEEDMICVSYYVSDWFNDDSTVISYSNGMEK